MIFIFLFLLPILGLYSDPPKEKGLRLKELSVTEESIIISKSGSATQRLAVVVGLNEYSDKSISKLNKARYDALLFAKTLEDYGQFDQIAVLTDEKDARGIDYPNKKNIETKINVILSKANPNDFFLFFFSGHGVSDSSGRGYVLPADADSEKIGDDRYINESTVSVDWLTEKIKKKGIKRSILILDACRDNPTRGTKSALYNDLRSEDYANSQIAAVFYSTKSGLYSYEDPDSDNGVFTKFLVEAMMGSADRANNTGTKDNVITFSEIQEYVTQKVDAWSTKNNKLQKPYIKMNEEFTGTIPITAYEGDPIVVRAQRDRTFGALWRSALVPGWGQYHKEEYWKAFGFGITTLGLLGGVGAAYSNYQSTVSDYNSAANRALTFSFLTTEAGFFTYWNYNSIQSSKSDIQSASGSVSAAGGVLLAIYLLNVLDAGTYRDINREIGRLEPVEGWRMSQNREFLSGQMGIYNSLEYIRKF